MTKPMTDREKSRIAYIVFVTIVWTTVTLLVAGSAIKNLSDPSRAISIDSQMKKMEEILNEHP
jgi:hypothetical protein